MFNKWVFILKYWQNGRGHWCEFETGTSFPEQETFSGSKLELNSNLMRTKYEPKSSPIIGALQRDKRFSKCNWPKAQHVSKFEPQVTRNSMIDQELDDLKQNLAHTLNFLDYPQSLVDEQ